MNNSNYEGNDFVEMALRMQSMPAPISISILLYVYVYEDKEVSFPSSSWRFYLAFSSWSRAAEAGRAQLHLKPFLHQVRTQDCQKPEARSSGSMSD